MVAEMEAEELYYEDHFSRQVLLDQREHDTIRAFLHQLKHDPLYATEGAADRSGLWESYLGFLNGMREEDYEFRRGLGIFDFVPSHGRVTAAQDGS